mgnify:CR=1 FL=1
MNVLLRGGLLCACLAGVAGCTATSGNAVDTLWFALRGQPSVVTPERLAALSTPALEINLGYANVLMVLGNQTGERQEWVGTAEMLVTHHGRVTQLVGLPIDPIMPLLPNDPFMSGLHRVADGTRVTRLVDYPARYQTGLRQHATYRQRGVTQQVIHGETLELLRVDEEIRMPELGFRATNRYWLNPQTGFIHRSAQHLAPDLPVMELVVINPGRSTP